MILLLLQQSLFFIFFSLFHLFVNFYLIYESCLFLDVFGSNDMWICKPSSSSRGRGIEIYNNLNSIIKYAQENKDSIIQKYLEYPILVEDRKFDIRQWFMVTCWDPLGRVKNSISRNFLTNIRFFGIFLILVTNSVLDQNVDS